MIYEPANSPPANTNIGLACFDPRFSVYTKPLYSRHITMKSKDCKFIAFQMFGKAVIELPAEPSKLEQELVETG